MQEGRGDVGTWAPAGAAATVRLRQAPAGGPGTPTLTRAAILFPSAMLSVRAAELEPPWPGLLASLDGSGGHVVVRPVHEGEAVPFGTVATVRNVGAMVVLVGVRAVRITGEYRGDDQVTYTTWSPVERTQPPDSARAVLDTVRKALKAWCTASGRPAPVGVERDDVHLAADIACATLFHDQPAYAGLLGHDAAYRLQYCADWLARHDARPQRAPARPPATRLDDGFQVVPPEQLPGLDDLGGMDGIKSRLRDAVGFLVEHKPAAGELQVELNGILLHGPPGTGKTTLARALAGEYDMRCIRVTGGDVNGPRQGDAETNVRRVFEVAARNVPCVLLFDDFESLAGVRDGAGAYAVQARAVPELLRGLDEVRSRQGVLVVATTNSLDSLDEAVKRAGRFDFRIRVDLPDDDTRRAILMARLKGLPGGEVLNLDYVVARTEGRSAADLAALVEAAKLVAMRRQAGRGEESAHLTRADLEGALEERQGNDTPTLPRKSWDDLVLASETLSELKGLADLMADPRGAAEFGLKPPTGALLYGPPGTGKTTIAQVMASEMANRVSFVPVRGSDVVSKWVGDSARNVRQLFERARAESPAILFIDEIEAILSRRDGEAVHQEVGSAVSEFLQQMDGINSVPGVFVLGATNLPDRLDPAVRRGGRLSREIEIPLPDAGQRERLFQLYSRNRRLAGDIDWAGLARMSESFSGADIEAVCDEATEHAYRRATEPRAVCDQDFRAVLRRKLPTTQVERLTWDDVVLPQQTMVELQALVRMIAEPEEALRFGLEVPVGAVLTGPSGTGKTRIARVIAAELHGRVGFVTAQSSEIVGSHVGESARNLRALFERARAHTPTVLFIDEIETLLPRRGAGGGDGGMERESVVTELLQQLDGLRSRPGVFVLGATNLPERLDPAVTRGGRLGRRIEIPRPDGAGRERLLRLFCRDLRLHDDVDLGGLAERTDGLSGADLKDLVQRAAQHAFVRASEPRAVTMAELIEVLERGQPPA